MMELTRIEKENIESFRALLPEGEVLTGQSAVGLVDEDRTAVAAAVLSSLGRGVTLDWFLVHPKYRRQGAGTTLLFRIKELLAKEAEALHVSYLREFPGFEAFLLQNGFLITGGDPVYTVKAGDASESPLGAELKRYEASRRVKRISELDTKEKEELRHFAREQIGSGKVLARCAPELSFVIYDREEITACLLLEPAEEDVYQVSLLLSTAEETETMSLLKGLLDNVLSQKKRSTLLRFVAVGDSVERLARRLYPEDTEPESSELCYAVYAL